MAQKAYSVDGNNTLYRAALGAAHIKTSRWIDAIAVIEKSVDSDDLDAEAVKQLLLTRAYYEIDKNKAKELYSKSLKYIADHRNEMDVWSSQAEWQMHWELMEELKILIKN